MFLYLYILCFIYTYDNNNDKGFMQSEIKCPIGLKCVFLCSAITHL